MQASYIPDVVDGTCAGSSCWPPMSPSAGASRTRSSAWARGSPRPSRSRGWALGSGTSPTTRSCGPRDCLRSTGSAPTTSRAVTGPTPSACILRPRSGGRRGTPCDRDVRTDRHRVPHRPGRTGESAASTAAPRSSPTPTGSPCASWGPRRTSPKSARPLRPCTRPPPSSVAAPPSSTASPSRPTTTRRMTRADAHATPDRDSLARLRGPQQRRDRRAALPRRAHNQVARRKDPARPRRRQPRAGSLPLPLIPTATRLVARILHLRHLVVPCALLRILVRRVR